MDASRRLAGELIHPPGAGALAELGLLEHLQPDDGAAVKGFSVHFGDSSAPVRLPYRGGNTHVGAFALEHSLIRERMMEAVARLPRCRLSMRRRETNSSCRWGAWRRKAVP